MTVLNPAALALALVAIPVILLYVLKLRRQERAVASTLLWRRAIDDVQANAPWQRLRPSILLLLQLLALAALVLALARPAYTQAHGFDGDTIVIVDQSYGMQAHDVKPSRFAQALARAHALAGDLTGGNVMSVVGMSDQPRLAVAESDNHGAIDRAIDSLRPGPLAPNFLRSLSLAASLARSGAGTRVVVLTSRNSGISSLPIAVPFPVQIVRVGGRLHDLGITAFQATHGPAGTRALLRISNFGETVAQSDVDLFVNGQLADVRPVTIAAGAERNLFWGSLPRTARQLEARIVRADDVDQDKSAWAIIPEPVNQRILLVSPGDYFLQTALALTGSENVTTVRPSAYRTPPAGAYDIIAFDGALPRSLPAAPLLIVNPPAGRSSGLQVGPSGPIGPISLATIGNGPVSSVLQFVDLGDVHIARAPSTRLPDWMTTLASAGGHTLIAAGDSGSTRIVLYAFNLQESDWPLRISFPVAVQNSLRYLSPGLSVGAANISAGRPLAFRPAPGTTEIEVGRPDGRTIRLLSPFPPYSDTGRTGIYTAQALRNQGKISTARVAVNFFPARTAAAGGPDSEWFGNKAARGGNGRTVSIPVSVAWVLGLAALGLLIAEWSRAALRG